jgi:hypothetical protein
MRARSARPLVALGAALALVGGAGAPAWAQPATLGVFVVDTTVGVNTEGTIVSSLLSASESVIVTDPTITYDASELAGQVTLAPTDTFGVTCTSPATAVLECTAKFEIGISPEYPELDAFRVRVQPAATATAGATGQLKTTFRGTGFAPATGTSRIRVGGTANLATTEPEEPVFVRPGAAFAGPVSIRNAAQNVADGAVVVFEHHPYAFRPRTTHRNCDYHQGRLFACRFDTALQPSTSYRAQLPFTLRKDTLAPSEWSTVYTLMTPAEYEDYTTYLRGIAGVVTTPGTGAPLPLRRVTAARVGKPQVDPDWTDNSAHVRLATTGHNPADLAALGTTVTGRAGEVVKAVVGLVDRGPASIDLSNDIYPVTTLVVSVPRGTTVVGVPPSCFQTPFDEFGGRSNDPGASTYYCDSSNFVRAGKPQTFSFSLRIDTVIRGASGTAHVNADCGCPIFRDDHTTRNDVAPIRVNP